MQSRVAKNQNKEAVKLSVKERILALRLFEKQKKYPEQAKQIGIEIKMKEKRQK